MANKREKMNIDVNMPREEIQTRIENEKREVYLNFSREIKSKIIKYLYDKTKGNEKINRRLIAESMDKKIPDINNDVNDLIKQKFIEKNSQDNLVLTPWGFAICEAFEQFLGNMIKNKNYFLEHDLQKIPAHFRESMGVFDNCSIISGQASHIMIERKEIEIMDNSKKYIYNLLHDGRYNQEIMNLLINKSEKIKYFKMRTVLDRNGFAGQGSTGEEISKLDENLKLNGSTRELRKMSGVTVSIIMNESEALVMFPLINTEKPDITQAFYGKDEKFVEWCHDFFIQRWELSTPS